jgi:hypothetical protein
VIVERERPFLKERKLESDVISNLPGKSLGSLRQAIMGIDLSSPQKIKVPGVTAEGTLIRIWTDQISYLSDRVPELVTNRSCAPQFAKILSDPIPTARTGNSR